MITLFTGMPGAGKTAAMVDLLRQFAGDRPIYVHFDPEARRRPDQKMLHETLTLPHQPTHANTWYLDVPDGAVLVIDEVQDVWRPRGPGSKVPEAIAQLETHRHAGVDVFLTTQAPRLVDANVRGLVGRHVHIRDTGFLGRYWYEWPECNEAMVWKSCPNKRKFKLPKQVFDMYTSANVHTKPVRSTPLVLYVAVAAVAGLALCIFLVYRVVTRGAPVEEAKKADKPAAISPSTQAAPAAPGRSGGLIDDRVDWIPRVGHRPESAPAFDHLRIVVVMPRVTGAICIDDKCMCHTQQGTNAGLTNDQCKAWAANRPFDPYVAQQAPEALSGERGRGQGASREVNAGDTTVSPFALLTGGATAAR